jgi:hypothetical protein
LDLSAPEYVPRGYSTENPGYVGSKKPSISEHTLDGLHSFKRRMSPPSRNSSFSSGFSVNINQNAINIDDPTNSLHNLHLDDEDTFHAEPEDTFERDELYSSFVSMKVIIFLNSFSPKV